MCWLIQQLVATLPACDPRILPEQAVGCSFLTPRRRLDYGGWLSSVPPHLGCKSTRLVVGTSSGVQFAGMAVGTVSFSFCFPEAHITVLTVQLHPPPSWLLPFLFFVLFSDYYQMLAACPAFLVCWYHSSCLPGDPSVPLGQALDAALHLCVRTSLPPYPRPPDSGLLPPAMPLSPPNPCGHCCHLLALPAPAVLCVSNALVAGKRY